MFKFACITLELKEIRANVDSRGITTTDGIAAKQFTDMPIVTLVGFKSFLIKLAKEKQFFFDLVCGLKYVFLNL